MPDTTNTISFHKWAITLLSFFLIFYTQSNASGDKQITRIPIQEKEDKNKETITMLFIGEKGVGKTTAINLIANFMKDVKPYASQRYILEPVNTTDASYSDPIYEYFLSSDITKFKDYNFRIIEATLDSSNSQSNTAHIRNYLLNNNNPIPIDVIFFTYSNAHRRFDAAKQIFFWFFKSLFPQASKSIKNQLIALFTHCDPYKTPIDILNQQFTFNDHYLKTNNGWVDIDERDENWVRIYKDFYEGSKKCFLETLLPEIIENKKNQAIQPIIVANDTNENAFNNDNPNQPTNPSQIGSNNTYSLKEDSQNPQKNWNPAIVSVLGCIGLVICIGIVLTKKSKNQNRQK